jgi:hypothetical protein
MWWFDCVVKRVEWRSDVVHILFVLLHSCMASVLIAFSYVLLPSLTKMNH